MCSMINNSCPTSTVAGYQFVSHYDCVNAGYAIAQKTFRNLQAHEEYQREIVEKEKLAIKFICKEMTGEQA